MDSHVAVWLVVKTKPRQEERARENLERQGYKVYLPKLSVKKHIRGLWRLVAEPLFPGYIFIHIDLAKVSLAPVRSTLGVNDLVRFGQQVVPVPDEVMNYIQWRESEAIDNPKDTLPLSIGDKVDVLEGPFAGLSAIFQMTKGAERAMLMVSLLGRSNTVVVPLDHIAPAK